MAGREGNIVIRFSRTQGTGASNFESMQHNSRVLIKGGNLHLNFGLSKLIRQSLMTCAHETGRLSM